MASSVRPSGPGPAPGLPGTSGTSRRSIRLGSPSKGGGAQPKHFISTCLLYVQEAVTQFI